MLEALRLEGGRWTILGVHSGSEVVRAEPFGEIDLPLQSLWTDSEDTPGRLTPSQALIAERRSGR